MGDSDGYPGFYENPEGGVGEEDVDDNEASEELEAGRHNADRQGEGEGEGGLVTPPTGGSRRGHTGGTTPPLAHERGSRGKGRVLLACRV